MQFVVPAFHAVGTLVSDILSFLGPGDAVALAVHQHQELVFVGSDGHDVADLNRQLQLPALALDRRPILPGGHFFRTVRSRLLRWENRKAVGQTDFVAQLAELFQGFGVLPQLLSGLEADAVDNEMGVGMVGVAVGRNQNLVPGPGLAANSNAISWAWAWVMSASGEKDWTY